MAKQVEDIVVRLVGEGFEALDKIKGSFRELGKVTNLAEKDILSARDSLLDFAKKAGNTEAVNKGLTDAFKGLRSQVDLSSEAYRSLSAELQRLDEESKGATRSIMAQRDAVLSSTVAGTQNVAALQQQRAALPREVDEISELRTNRCAIVVKRRPIKEITLGRSPRRVADHASSPANQCNGATTVQL